MKITQPSKGFPVEYGTTYDTVHSAALIHRGFHALPTYRYQERESDLHPQQYGADGQS